MDREAHAQQGQSWDTLQASLAALNLDEDASLEIGHLHCGVYAVNEAGSERCREIIEKDSEKAAYIAKVSGAAPDQVTSILRLLQTNRWAILSSEAANASACTFDR